MRSGMLALLLALTLSSLLRAEENTNIPTLRPEATIPLFTKAPSIDGVIKADEWPTLHVSRFVAQNPGGRDLLQTRQGEFRVGCDGTALYIAVSSGVHPTAGIVAKHQPEGKKDIGETIYDDSIEIWIDNDPAGGKGKYYQFMINSLGATFDKMYDRADGSANLWWRPEGLQQGHTVANGTWTAEFSIPLQELEITDPGKPIGLRVCRNYKQNWDQSRWAPGVNAFDSAETMGRVRFVAAAPVVSEVGFQKEEGIAVSIDLSNPGAQPLPVHVKLGYNAEQQPRYYQEWDYSLSPAETKRFTYEKEFFTPENYPALAEIQVTGPEGAVYYRRDVKWETKPAATWAKMAVAGKEEAFELALEWHPTPKLLRWRTDYSSFRDRETIKALRLVVLRTEGGKPVAEQRTEAPAGFTAEGRLILPALEDGTFTVALFADPAEPSIEPVKTLPFEHRSDFVWLNNNIGKSDAVIPPFLPLTVKGESVTAILRTHTLTTNGLWSSVIADGEELLAAPMHFEIRQGGKLQPFQGELVFTSSTPSRVEASATWQSGDLQGKTRSELEMDGCMKVTLTLTQEGETPLEGMDLVIPLKNEFMPLMHAAGDGLRINYAGSVPAGAGEIWSSIKASRSDLIGTFLPYLWIGEEGRGLSWFAENDRDWVVDTSDKTPALALEREGDTLNLRIRLIQKPVVLKRPHTLTFGLMATPAKPMPEGWRREGLFHGGKENTTFLGMCMYWGGQLYGVFPAERDFTVVRKIAESGKEGKTDPDFFKDYTEKHPDVAAEVRWSAGLRNAAAIVPYTNLRGDITYSPEWRVYQDEWRRGNFEWRQTDPTKTTGAIDFRVIPTPSRIDFLLYYYREFLKNGMDGIYWDNICIYSNANRITGNGYLREDGLFQPEADIWRLREVTKRTAVLAHELGKVNRNMPHMTNASLAPAFSWTGYYLGWEWKYGDTDWQTRFTREYIRTVNIGRQTGNRPGVLEGHTNQIKDPALRTWVQRTRAGVALTHEIIVQMPDPLLTRAREALFAIGYGDDTGQVFNYWERNPVAQVERMESSWLVCSSGRELLMILCDWGEGSSSVTVTLDPARLGLPADCTVVNWENPEEKTNAVKGRFTLADFKKHDLRILSIKKEE